MINMVLESQSLNVEDVLKGLSSETRLVIINSLRNNPKPAIEIFNDISPRIGIKNRETIYRALERLVEIKILEKKYDFYKKKFLYKIAVRTINFFSISN